MCLDVVVIDEITVSVSFLKQSNTFFIQNCSHEHPPKAIRYGIFDACSVQNALTIWLNPNNSSTFGN